MASSIEQYLQSLVEIEHALKGARKEGGVRALSKGSLGRLHGILQIGATGEVGGTIHAGLNDALLTLQAQETVARDDEERERVKETAVNAVLALIATCREQLQKCGRMGGIREQQRSEPEFDTLGA